MTSKVAVMLPIYNAERTLQRCLDSIKNQTYKNWVIVAFDDGSTDKSLEILKANASDKIVIFNVPKNMECPPAARNFILDAINKDPRFAGVKYIAVQDADDWSTSDRFELQVAFMDKNPDYGICGSFFYWHEAEKNVKVLFDFSDTTDEEIRKSQYFKSNTCHGSFLIRKEVFDAVGYYDTNFRWCHDRDWIIRFLYNKKWKICTLPQYLYYAWITEYTHSKTEERLINESKHRYKMYCNGVGIEYKESNWRA